MNAVEIAKLVIERKLIYEFNGNETVNTLAQAVIDAEELAKEHAVGAAFGYCNGENESCSQWLKKYAGEEGPK